MDYKTSDVPHMRLACKDVPLPKNMLEVGAFTETMAHLASAVCVASASEGEARHGRTITTAISLSTQPPSLLISITKETELARMVLKTRGFSLAFLAEDQQPVSDAFAGKSRLADRFLAGTWTQWPSGRPKLEGAATSLDCSLAGVIEMDTHYLFAGIPVASQITERKPLVWHRRGYHGLD